MYKQRILTAEEQVIAVRAGDVESMLLGCVGYIVSQSNKYVRTYSPSVTYEDYIQEGMIGALEAFKTYSTDSGTSFLTYARANIMWKMVGLYRQNNTFNENVDDVVLISETNGTADTEIDAHRILNEMSDKSMDIAIRILYKEETLASIGKELGVSHQAVDCVYKTAINRARKNLG